MSHHIVQVSRFYMPLRGGQETYIENLHQILFHAGYSSQVVQAIRDFEHYDHVKKLFFIPRFFNKLVVDADWFQINLGLTLIKQFLRQADVLICHYPFHYPAIQWHPRVIVLSHGVDWREPPQTLADRYRVQATQLCQQRRPFIVANDTHFLRKIGFSILPKTCEFQQVDHKVWYIPNCVDIDYFKPLQCDRKNIILVPRNLRPVRGVHLAIESFGLISQKLDDYEMWVVGDGLRGDYYKHCQQLVRDLNLKERVRFLGSIPWKEMVTYYNQAKLSLIPTLALEGTSLSALESMACRTPTISTDVAGLKDLPTVKAKPEAESLAQAMIETLSEWDHFSGTQYNEVINTFNLARWREAWLTVIQHALDS